MAVLPCENLFDNCIYSDLRISYECSCILNLVQIACKCKFKSDSNHYCNEIIDRCDNSKDACLILPEDTCYSYSLPPFQPPPTSERFNKLSTTSVSKHSYTSARENIFQFSTNSAPSEASNSNGAIIGGVLGSIGFVVIVIAILLILYFRRKRSSDAANAIYTEAPYSGIEENMYELSTNQTKDTSHPTNQQPPNQSSLSTYPHVPTEEKGSSKDGEVVYENNAVAINNDEDEESVGAGYSRVLPPPRHR